jgi:hypothetical protein
VVIYIILQGGKFIKEISPSGLIQSCLRDCQFCGFEKRDEPWQLDRLCSEVNIFLIVAFMEGEEIGRVLFTLLAWWSGRWAKETMRVS